MYSKVHSHITARNLKSFNSFDAKDYKDLPKLGIDVNAIADSHSMDALEAPYITGTSNTPIQFLQNWLPGFVKNLTTARKIDEILGRVTIGSWEDEQIVQQTMERTGKPSLYGDYSEIPYSSYANGHEVRTIVRFEEGMIVTKLEEQRQNKNPGANDSQFKREAAALALDIVRNEVGFNGFNGGANKTYGLLNDPNLPAYVNLPNGVGGNPEWSTKTFLEITADIRNAIADLRTQSGDNIDPERTPITMAIATNAVDFLSVTSDFGNSVMQWLKETYPAVRVVSTPDFDEANGGANVFYLIAEGEQMSDSTDGGNAIIQMVPNSFYTVGTQQTAKGRIEDYSNALAGVLVKRPYLVVRRSGC